ncbi:putative retrotransposon gag domain, aspartic peptidase domain-containing protein [Rosa chinensis]|uniref:Putative retrotransposon gag domain, aspartic peptidase domain-containing protein n=1 Tax=Rosa chinensis TaxID=74649 RepID=A0A2P6RFR8_ROSCH|nr:putative retrotransposon gag domain, aspartic peptidase domain-containing protein [Rosa chinensis]
MQPHNPYPFDNQCFRPPKVDLPRFYGDNAAGGLSMAERYLRTQNIPTHAHIATVASHFGPTASIWMNSFDQSNPSASWEQFVGAFLQHFGGCTTIDFKVSLSHMQQTSSVDAFINEFTTLAYRAPEWSDANLLSIFLGGLKPAIRHDVVAIEPRSLAYAQRLARRYETKQADNQPSRPPHPSNWSYSHKALPSNIPSAPTTHTTTSQITPFSHPDTSQKQKAETSFCKWSTSKQREGRAQGLCYSCDEQWSQTHVGKRPVMAILESPTPLEELPIEEIVEEEQPSDSEQFIPIHAITHTMIGHMMRCKGFINKQPISVFVDCRSATNFLNPVVATRLGLTMQPVSQLHFTSASGEQLSRSSQAIDATDSIQGYQFTTSFLLMLVTGCDLLLGAQWLETLGFIGWHFSETVMVFTENGQCHVLNDLQRQPSQKYQSAFRALLPAEHLDSVSSITGPITIPESALIPELQTLLPHYEDVFSPPVDLLPKRAIDHRMTLLPNSGPMNMRPYRYAHSQKTDLDAQVQEMLSHGLIRPSHSPFSSRLGKRLKRSWHLFLTLAAVVGLSFKGAGLLGIIYLIPL